MHKPYERGGLDNEVLRAEVEALRAEVMRLRAQIAHLERANGTQEVSDE
jgi:cell division protein FtsB